MGNKLWEHFINISFPSLFSVPVRSDSVGPLKVTTAEFMGALKFAARVPTARVAWVATSSYGELRGATWGYVEVRCLTYTALFAY